MTAIPIHKVMRSELLLGNSFAGSSWDLWETVVKSANAIKLSPSELAAFNAVAGGRKPPAKRVKELVCVVGRGGGKDSVAALLAVHAAISFDSKRGKLRPGEYAYVLCVACDRDQAALVYRYIKGHFIETPTLARMVKAETANSLTLSNRTIVEVSTNSFRAVRGRSILCCIMDEVALFRSEQSANPDVELYAAVRPGLARVKGSMSVLISTAYKRSGLLYERFKTFYGKDDDDILVVKGTTREFNSLFDQAEIDKDLARDPAKFSAEYLSEWRDDLSTFIDRALVENSIDRGVIVRPPQQNVFYTSFCDPSGGRHDSFSAAVTHKEKDTAVLDCLIEVKAPFDPEVATRDICAVLKSYNVRRTTADKYAGEWTVSAFARNGVTLANSDRDRSQIYLDVLPLFASGRVRLLDNARLAAQFSNLERRTFPSGKDRVDHAVGAADDASNSAAGALILAVNKEPLTFSAEVLERSREVTRWARPHSRPRPFSRNAFRFPF
jgi:hypothetical protein